MNDFSALVLDFFHKHPYTEASTTELIKEIYPQEYERIKEALHDPYSDKEARTVAKRHKGQLHRRLLYHLNRLVDEGTLHISTIKGKGEKCYVLAQQAAGAANHQAAVLPTPFARLDYYKEHKVLAVFDQRNWHHRLNAIIINVKQSDTTVTVRQHVEKALQLTNDSVGIVGAERLIASEDLSGLSTFLKQLDVDTRDNNKTITLHIDLALTPQTASTEDFFDTYAAMRPARVNLCLGITHPFLLKHQRLLKHIIRAFAEHTIKINLHNKDVHASPILVSSAGTCTLAEQDWQHYLSVGGGQPICASQHSVAIDVQRYFSLKKSNKEFREFIIKLAKGLLESSLQQRRYADPSSLSNEGNPHAFFRYGTNLIRLWNYDWQEEEQPHFIELLSTVAAELEEFCLAEENIFKSCGMPIRFRVSLASTFPHFEQGFFSQRRYKKLTVNNGKDLSDPVMRKFLLARERLFKVFNGNDRLRIFRSTPVDPDDVLQEIRFLSSTYALPLLTYDFAKRKTYLTLDQFIG